LFTLPSQSPKPLLHASVAQLPEAQLVTAFAREHGALQAPQSWLVFVLVSQPLFTLPSQSPKPTLHAVVVQVPVAHDAVALGRLHAVPHAPQLAAVRSDVSQPLTAEASQLA
jgi:hypothetical protein